MSTTRRRSTPCGTGSPSWSGCSPKGSEQGRPRGLPEQPPEPATGRPASYPPTMRRPTRPRRTALTSPIRRVSVWRSPRVVAMIRLGYSQPLPSLSASRPYRSAPRNVSPDRQVNVAELASFCRGRVMTAGTLGLRNHPDRRVRPALKCRRFTAEEGRVQPFVALTSSVDGRYLGEAVASR